MSKKRGRDKRKQRLKAKQKRQRRLETPEGLAELGAKMPVERCLMTEDWRRRQSMT